MLGCHFGFKKPGPFQVVLGCLMERLQTKCGSSTTLVRGMELANEPLPSLLCVKTEPDEEEQAMEAEMQETLLGPNVISLPRTGRLLNSIHSCSSPSVDPNKQSQKQKPCRVTWL